VIRVTRALLLDAKLPEKQLRNSAIAMTHPGSTAERTGKEDILDNLICRL
jgi:hypothetical protein